MTTQSVEHLLAEAIDQIRNLTGLAEMRGGNLHEYGAAIKDAKDLIARASGYSIEQGFGGTREAAIKEALQAVGMAAWKHIGDDAYSRGMDAGATHQIRECLKAVSALLPAAPGGTDAEG